MYYICKDRQGSITALVRQDKSVAEKFSYDAWGRRRNPNNWADFNVKAPRLINRGYTGHSLSRPCGKMLDAFGLINMNGSMGVYPDKRSEIGNPVIGRILSPDKYVQSPGYTQSYNRYSYCFNNPLRYTDPSGWYVDIGRGINTVFESHEVSFYTYGIGSPGNYYSGGGGNTTIGPQGYRYVGGGVYMDVATAKGVDFSTVYSNYVVPNSITYTGQPARNFVELVNKLGQFSIGVNGNQVVILYIPSSNLLASNGPNSAPASGLRTGSQFFSGTLGALTVEGSETGKEGPGLGMSGAYYRGYIGIDAIFDLSTNSLSGYDLNISASFISATEKSLSGKVEIFHNGFINTFMLSPNREAINRSGYNEIGSLSCWLSPNTYYLHVKINISLKLNGGTYNARTFDSYGFDF